MYMIINVGGNSKTTITADTVEYGDSNVANTLDTLKFNDSFLSGVLSNVDTNVNNMAGTVNNLSGTVNGLTDSFFNMSGAIGVLENELTANGKRIYLDYKDGKYGYNTSAQRGADTFSPFKSGGLEFPVLNTKYYIAGNKLPTVTGCGYFSLMKMSGSNSIDINVYIDGNTNPFNITGVTPITFFFQESIRFVGEDYGDEFLYQTQLASGVIDKKYNITQGSISNGYATITGKGTVLLSSGYSNTNMNFYLDTTDENNINSMLLRGDVPIRLSFNSRISFESGNSSYPIYYIAYTEK